MALPAEIPVRYTEEDAGYVSVRPVVKQSFRLDELADMVVRVAGKDATRVQKIFQSGTVVYNGYRYWWEGIPAELAEIESVLLPFPEDDPAIPFEPAKATSVLFEIGGGTQRNVFEIQRSEASERKLFANTTPWNMILGLAGTLPARYEKYSHARKADLFRVPLSYDKAQALLRSMLQNAPRSLRNRWSALQPPAVVTFVCPR
jgi:hypothetical protein